MLRAQCCDPLFTAQVVLSFTGRHLNRAKGKVTLGERRSHLAQGLCPGQQGPGRGLQDSTHHQGAVGVATRAEESKRCHGGE